MTMSLMLMQQRTTAVAGGAALSSRRSTATSAAFSRVHARTTQRHAAVIKCRAAADESSSSSSDAKKMVVAVTGATGFVGKKLVERLMEEGHEVRVLTRNSNAARLALPKATLGGAKVYAHDNSAGNPLEWYDAIKGCTAVVNLAGAPISNPWNEDYKKVLVKSRLSTTKRLAGAINRLPEDERPNLVSSSAVGYYGTSKKAEFDESSRPGRDFLANLCVQWEDAASKADTANTTIIRTGVVLEKGGGALGKILPVFQLYAGGPLGSGKQWLSWIHRDDLVGLIMAALTEPEKYAGVINGTAPEPTTMGGLCEAVAEATGRPNWLPVPGFALKAILGEGATVVLDGQKVLPKKTKALGYEFKYTDVNQAVSDIVNA